MTRQTTATMLALSTLGLVASAASGQTLLFDVGAERADDTGTTTSSPDGNGNNWNNITGPVLADAVDTSGSTTGIGVQFLTGFSANGGAGLGGLFGPDAGLLGNLAVETATQDYFFTSGTAVNSFEFTGLQAGVTYDLDLFGTRNTSGFRDTLYQITHGGGVNSAVLQTSGTGAGTNTPTGNDDDLASFVGLTADGNGKITVDFSSNNASFGYLGAMRLTVVPSPSTALALCGVGVLAARRRR